MSDASGQEQAPSAVASETSTSDSGASQHGRGKQLILVARILATVGALLFVVGAWMPWVVVTGYTFVSGQRQDYTLALSPGDVEGIFGSFVWSALTVVGVLLLPLVWWRSQAWISILVFTAWLILVGVLVPPALSISHDVSLAPGLHPRTLIITHNGQWLLGFWIAFAGVSLAFVGAILLIISNVFRQPQRWEIWRADERTGAASVRPRVALPGASALTIGLALWAVGTFVMPWASVNCNINPLIIGTCTGLSYHSVLQIGIADATTLIDPLVAHYAVGLLLSGGAAMVLAGLWLRARSVAFCGWATLWLVLAAAFAWLADYGVGVVVEKHDALGLPAGTWSGENAVLVTLLGFVLALGGLAYLWVDALRNRRTRAMAS